MDRKQDLFDIGDGQDAKKAAAVANRYRRILESSRDGIIAFDSDHIIHFANPEAALLLDTTLVKMTQQSMEVLLGSENFRIIRDLAESCTGNQSKICSTVTLITRRGKERHLEICISCDRDQGIELYSLHLSDQTELNEALSELRQRNAFFNNLLDSSVDGIIAGNMRGKIVLFNRGAQELLGYTNEEAMTKLHITRLYPEGEAGKIMENLRSEKYGGKGRLSRQRLIGIAKDGQKIPISLSGSIIYDDNGNEFATVGIFTDMRTFDKMERELSKKQRELIQSERMASLGKLAAGVAHEINNPLTGILTFAEELVDDSDKNDPLYDDYKIIHRETLRCREIVRNLLDFAKQDRLVMRQANINHIVMLTFGLVRRLASFRNIEITHNLAEELPAVICDPHQLQQVFLNLMVNASEAMESGGELYIATRTRKEGSEVEISFSDTGDGIPPEVLPKIFEPFFSTKGGKTNGLGLAVSWGIIEQHGGRIELDTAMGLGTTFHVFLPGAGTEAAERVSLAFSESEKAD